MKGRERPPDLGQIRNVVQNLERLTKLMPTLLADEDVKDQAVRLRLLLVDDGYLRAWRGVGFDDQPTITAPDLLGMVGDVLPTTVWAPSGGAQHQGSVVWGARMSIGKVRTPEQVRASYERQKAASELRPLRVKEFLNAAGAVVQGKPVSRQRVIQYVANKLGAAHYGPQPGDPPEYALLEKITAHDPAKRNVVIGDLQQVY